MTLTRRDTSKLLLTGAALAASASPAAGFLHKRIKRDDWPALLQQDLNDHLLDGCDGTLTLRAFDYKRGSGRFQMAAVVELDWPPGLRTRRFDALGNAEQAAYNALLNQALFSFAKAWPGCVV